MNITIRTLGCGALVALGVIARIFTLATTFDRLFGRLLEVRMKPISRTILVGAFATFAFAAPASAVPIAIVGNALGCFGVSCTPAENFGIFTTPTGANLTYTSAVPVDFSGDTDLGFLAINGTTGTFGSIGLGPGPLFQASLFGAVSSDPTSGGILLTFTSPPQSISFTNGIPGDVSGSLTVLANSTSLPPGQDTQITGFIMPTAPTVVTPEPGALGLMAVGLAGILGLAWRRRRGRDLV
jgi:hypothetical protein